MTWEHLGPSFRRLEAILELSYTGKRVNLTMLTLHLFDMFFFAAWGTTWGSSWDILWPSLKLCYTGKLVNWKMLILHWFYMLF